MPYQREEQSAIADATKALNSQEPPLLPHVFSTKNGREVLVKESWCCNTLSSWLAVWHLWWRSAQAETNRRPMPSCSAVSGLLPECRFSGKGHNTKQSGWEWIKTSSVFAPLREFVRYCSPHVQYNSNWSNRHIRRCSSRTCWSVCQPWQGTHIKLLHFIAVTKKGSFLSRAGDGLFFAHWNFVASFTQQKKSTRIRQGGSMEKKYV